MARQRRPDARRTSASAALVAGNIRALRLLRRIVAERRPATAAEIEVLRGFAGWSGAPADLFDDRRTAWTAKRAELKELLGPSAYEAAGVAAPSSRSTHPACVKEVWAALGRLGFDGGRVLEPGVGAGAFIAEAPPSAKITGVEIDPSVAALARTLHPEATIVTGSFADHRFAEGAFDAAVGSVPSGRGGVDRISVADRFIAETLRLTRPGGVVALLADHTTLDNPRPAARTEMAGLADLVGAVRLPAGARGPAADAEGPTDLLIFRRREPGAKPAPAPWVQSHKHKVGDQVLPVNNYFARNPTLVLGHVTARKEPGRRPRFHVQADLTKASLPEQLRAALEQIVPPREQALAAAPEQTAPVQPSLAEATQEAAAPEEVRREPQPAPARAHPDLRDPVLRQLCDGRISAHPDGTFTRLADGADVPLKVPRTQQAELRELLELRDGAAQLMSAEAAGDPDAPLYRVSLEHRHSEYVERHGPIDRVELKRTGHKDKQTGEPRLAPARPPVMGLLRSDPDAPLVQALDRFDATTGQTTRNPLLTGQLIEPTQQDPLAGDRQVLGRARCTWLEHRAGVLAVQHAGREQAWWEAERERTAAVLAPDVLDRRGALDTLCVEYTEQVQREHPDTASVTAEDIHAAHQELHDEGRHLGDWTRRHGEDAALWLAAERQLAAGKEAEKLIPDEQLEAARAPATEAEPAAPAIDAGAGLDLGPG
jgi:SAM-dependent methyltransferase